MSSLNKAGLSNLIAYVLLISITISLSVLVYGWLQFYVAEPNVGTCPDKVNLVIDNYDCVPGDSGSLNLTLKNKGFFKIDGYTLKVHERPGADFGLYVFDKNGVPLAPGASVTKFYPFNEYTFEPINKISYIDVQPFMIIDGDRVFCDAYSSVTVADCS